MSYLCLFIFLMPVLGGRLSSNDQNANFNIVQNPEQDTTLSKSESVIDGEVSSGNDEYAEKSFSEEAQPNEVVLWNSSHILYEFKNASKDAIRTNTTKNKVREAIKYLEELSCLKFEEIPYGTRAPEKRLTFLQAYSGTYGSNCWCEAMSPLEPETSLDKLIFVSDACDKGTITRLIIRKLGIIDEHRRPDRDQYIELLPKNIDTKENITVGFKKSTSKPDKNMFSKLPYDFNSITHMHPSEFAKSGENSFKIKPELQGKCENATIVQGKENRLLSSLDVFKINTAFGCSVKSTGFHLNVCAWKEYMMEEKSTSSK
ncbi:astacin-like metalloprotease toxin 2 isoform X1 [Planococcus citri]|uniref:astacin-like metalloprotease toxin 2 isoform X1 n=1 Tax=Planococcus citri TaxID=170843 RepID=UPI0031F809A0